MLKYFSNFFTNTNESILEILKYIFIEIIDLFYLGRFLEVDT